MTGTVAPRRRLLSVVAAVLVVALVVAVLLALRAARERTQSAARTVGSCSVLLHPGPDVRTHCPGVDWSGRSLSGTDLRFADLTDARLGGADLHDAVMFGADLSRADLRGADLRGADLTGAVLTDAQIEDARLDGAAIAGMQFSGTVLAASGQLVWVQPGQGPATVSWTSTSPSGVISNTCVDKQGLFYPGTTQVRCIVATGPDGYQVAQYDVPITVNQAPTVDAPATVAATVGQPVSVQLAASSPFPAIGLTALTGDLPDGLSWDQDTLQVVGTPTEAAIGTHVVVFRAENGMAAEASITMTVSAVDPVAPVDPAAPAGTTDPGATDPGAPDPAGIDPSTGLPTAAATAVPTEP